MLNAFLPPIEKHLSDFKTSDHKFWIQSAGLLQSSLLKMGPLNTQTELPKHTLDFTPFSQWGRIRRGPSVHRNTLRGLQPRTSPSMEHPRRNSSIAYPRTNPSTTNFTNIFKSLISLMTEDAPSLAWRWGCVLFLYDSFKNLNLSYGFPQLKPN